MARKKPPVVSALELLSGRSEKLSPRRSRTRQLLLDVATKRFVAAGYRGTSMDLIAGEARLSRATLYTYAKNKEQMLLQALAEEALDNLGVLANVYDPDRAPRERLHALVREALLYVTRMPLSARLARDRDPQVLRLLQEEQVFQNVLSAAPDLDKATYYARLIDEAFPDAFTGAQRDDLAALIRTLGHMAPSLSDDHARFGLTIETAAELLSGLFVDGLTQRSALSRRRSRRRG